MRRKVLFTSLIIGIGMVFLCSICTGAVDVPLRDVISIIMGKENVDESIKIIILESRLPMTVAALLSGAALSVSGLLLQTSFNNPLAGPSVLGVSSGASLGVALMMLTGIGNLPVAAEGLAFTRYGIFLGALLGSGIIIALLIMMRPVLRSNAMLLIVGLMASYFCSAIVSLLNFFSPAEGVKSYVIWGLGSFMGVSYSDMLPMSIVTITMLILSILLGKPLNAMLLGERYASNSGHNVKQVNILMLMITGVLTAIITAYCGPISFVGLIVPHLARIMFNTSNHHILLPASMLIGSLLMMLCAVATVLPTNLGVIPINAVTPIIGVPVIFYIIINRKNLKYFSH